LAGVGPQRGCCQLLPLANDGPKPIGRRLQAITPV